ncbi:C39 family peptidase [Salirhabdus salicampi]|uniref:C39 family peptidase n=1 Tax=Salirhabdus salicampi TaxID=476102 RepID=UPI0020C25628|nr:C39 family peptidase [Salirhabdus salicampi]MCP8615614.1 C39 family peptidase [Salirhabdus salicampi]
MNQKFALLIPVISILIGCSAKVAEEGMNSFFLENKGQLQESFLQQRKHHIVSKGIITHSLPSSTEHNNRIAEDNVSHSERSNDTNEEDNNKNYVTEPYEGTYEVKVDSGNVRTGPGLHYDIVTTLPFLTPLDAFEKAIVQGITWYHVRVSGQQGWVSSVIVQELSSSSRVLIDAPLISQLPELPRGCEVTTLAMLLVHAGVTVDKMTLAEEVTKDPTPYERQDGKVYFGNPHDGFVGNMYTLDEPGFGVFNEPIEELARKYLQDRIINLSGESFDKVLQQLDAGKPVWVINTSEFRYLPDSYWQTWETPTGKVKITYQEHSVLVTGYDDDYIYFNDPLFAQKNRAMPKESFIAGWKQYGSQAISYH